MKSLFNRSIISTLIFILSIALVVKLLYLVLSYLFLPTTGVELPKSVKLKGLSYSYKLAYKQRVKPTPKPKATPKPVRKKISMRGYKLIGLVSFGDRATIIVKKGSKTHVLSVGMDIDGFKLIRVSEDSAFFQKGGQEFELSMTSKIENPASAKKLDSLTRAVKRNSRVREEVKNSDNEFGIEKRDDVTVIPKNLLSSYTKDVDKIWKSIGLGEHRSGGKLDGFVVNYIKKDSVFEHIGLKRGDVLKSVNGEELDGYNTAFNIFRDIDNIDDLTITVLRDNKVVELEYEIH
jgi:general secretion pathway protein C